MSSPPVLPLAEAGAAAEVGGKGASLGELVRAGLPVPPGFVVTAGAFTAAMTAIDRDGALRASVEALPASDIESIARVSAALRAQIIGAPLPSSVADAITTGYPTLAGPAGSAGSAGAAVAVRSSATMEDGSAASFAGLQDTYLGVSGADAVLESVRRCWASLYNTESVAYRRRLGMPEPGLAMAVVVQRMVRPRAAGVMFTRSPVSGDRSVVAIEGTWGLGSALVSGDVTPDTFIISKITSEITARRVSSKIKIHQVIPNGPVTPRSPSTAFSSGEELQTPADPASGPAGEPFTGGNTVTVADTPPGLRDSPCLTDDEIRALAAVARRVEAHYGAPQDIEWAILDGGDSPNDPLAPAGSDSPMALAAPAATEDPASSGPPAAAPAPPAERIVLLQSRPETVWAAKERGPAGAPKPRAADHVLALFGKPL